jgi:hypothetical protein
MTCNTRNRYATHGRLLIARLKRKPHTYMQMLSYGLSTSPWKRVQETLLPHECLVKGRNKHGLTTWRVVAATRWTA